MAQYYTVTITKEVMKPYSSQLNKKVNQLAIIVRDWFVSGEQIKLLFAEAEGWCK